MSMSSDLAHVLPADTAEHPLFTATRITEIIGIHVANLTGSDATFRLWHVPAGGTPEDRYALIFDYSLKANSGIGVGAGIVLEPGDMIYVRSGTANALAYSLYGSASEVSPRIARVARIG